MEDKDLEITKEVVELSEIENNPKKPALDIENEVVEDEMDNIEITGLEENAQELEETIKEVEAIEETVEAIEELSEEVKDIKEKKKLKDKIKEKWNSFSKKKKIIIIVSSIIVLALIIGLIIFLVLKDDDNKSEKKKEQTIFEADNYRYENGSLILLNREKKEIGKYECNIKDEDKCYVAYIDMDDDLDVGKKIDEEGNLLPIRSNILKEKYVFIHDSEEENDAKLYDLSKKEIVESYTGVKTYSSIEDYAIVKDDSGSYGLIKLDDTIENTIKFNYTNMAIIEDNKDKKIIVDEDGRNYIIDYSEKALSKAISVPIVSYNDKYIVGEYENKYYLYDYKNNAIYEEYDYIKLVENYVALLKDGKLFIKDYENHKYNAEGIEIANDYKYYQKLFVYDKDNNYLESYQAFDVIVNQTTITVENGENTTVLSIDEGRISALTKFVDYFENVLYFYKDEAKTELLGTYKCTNENYVDSSSNSFNSCFIASDYAVSDNDMTTHKSQGMIPIINEKYVFIKDNQFSATEENSNIVLYDLSAKKSLGKFVNVNSNLNTNSNEVSLLSRNNIDIIAKNSKNKYGVITVNGNGEMTSLIAYSYDSIELIGDNYLVHDGSGYSLINKNGTELTKKVSEKIRGYNNKYLKVSNNSNYSIYDYEGKKITTSTYKYIELYDNYYAAVDSSNKLNIYAYSNVSESLIDSIQLNENKYYGDENIAFKINIIGTSANISILKDGNYVSSTYSLIKTVTPFIEETEVESEIE